MAWGRDGNVPKGGDFVGRKWRRSSPLGCKELSRGGLLYSSLEGYRYGLPRPSRPTIDVISNLMNDAGLTTEGERPEVIDIYEATPD